MAGIELAKRIHLIYIECVFCTIRTSRDYKEIKELEFFLGIQNTRRKLTV